jgi:hypothetical protein
VLAAVVLFEAIVIYLPIDYTKWTIAFVALTGVPLLAAMRRKPGERTVHNEIQKTCVEVDGGMWRWGWTFRRLHFFVAGFVFAIFMLMALGVTIANSDRARLAAASIGPILLLLAGLIQRSRHLGPSIDSSTASSNEPAPSGEGVAAGATPEPEGEPATS